MESYNNYMERAAFGHAKYRSLELSTQILLFEAEARGLKIEVLDAQNHVVRLRDVVSNQTEVVIQGSKTKLDSYLTTEIMSLKNLTKLLLAEVGIAVPFSRGYSALGEALSDWEACCQQVQGIAAQNQAYPDRLSRERLFDMIVKPNASNYGIGISQLPANTKTHDLEGALHLAFSYGDFVLIEEFLYGKEYRFLVIGGKLRAVLHRVPANVVGDGIHSIEELVTIKNEDPWRRPPVAESKVKIERSVQGRHRSPLEPIQIGQHELSLLQGQGLDGKSIPAQSQTVWLRSTSNISTGGDSFDVETVHHSYRDIAEQCAKTLGAQICGVDLITEDIQEDAKHCKYGIIEVNFNPAVYLHEYPAFGKSRKVVSTILDLLFPVT